jgi:hypothetical protein
MIKVGAKEIVKEGLVFFMDPANTTSYQPSATTAYDLSILAAKASFINFDTNNNFDPSDGGGSIIFDGVDDSIRVSTYGNVGIVPSAQTDSYLFSDEVTLEAFVKPSSFTSEPNIIGKGTNFGYRCRFTSDRRFWLYSESGTSINNIQTASNLINADEWVHVVAVFSQSGLFAYVNGVLQASNSQPFLPDILNPFSISCILHFGRFCGSGELFEGKMGIIRVYHAALTADEVLKNLEADRNRYGI